MRFVAIDYGLERTGLAVSDPDEQVVFPLKTLRLADFATRKHMLDALAENIRAASAEACVVGLPLQDQGESLICRQIRNVTRRLMHRLDLPFYFMNEYLSSEAALDDLRSGQVKINKRKFVLDQLAACHILESFFRLGVRPDPIEKP